MRYIQSLIENIQHMTHKTQNRCSLQQNRGLFSLAHQIASGQSMALPTGFLAWGWRLSVYLATPIFVTYTTLMHIFD